MNARPHESFVSHPRIAPDWRSLLTHTHMMSGGLPEPENQTNLINWMRSRGVDALGVGSPYTPATRANYQQYENDKRAIYYNPSFDPQSVKCEADVAAMIADLNRISAGGPYLYIDNETPKARYGHMWFVGWWHDFPEWHDYDQPFDRWMCHEQGPDDFRDEPMPYERRPYMEIVATQRARGAMAMWAHPTSWWFTPNGAFVTNIASEMPAHLIADGFIDGLVIMGYDAYRRYYLDLWFHLLDLGYEVLGLAETDLGLSAMKLWDLDPLFLTYFKHETQALTTPGIVKALKSGNVYASSGPAITLSIDGVPMGSRLTSAAGSSHIATVEVRAQPGKRLARLELISNGGKIIRTIEHPANGTHTFNLSGSNQHAYVIARVFGEGDLPGTKPDREIRQFAITNPVYLRPAGWQPFGPTKTEFNLNVAPSSRYVGGRAVFEDAVGNKLDESTLKGGETITADMPASGRCALTDAHGITTRQYLINANPQVTELQRYLYRGRFRKDYPEMVPGDVPAEAFQIEKFKKAMARLALTV